MQILTHKGNLLDVVEGWIVHGCNAQGIMGSGVALAVRQKYPECFYHYRSQYDISGLQLGTNNIYVASDKLVIVNAITQDNFGRSGKRYVSYDAIQSCFEDLNDKISSTQKIKQEIHIPLIGAGLGGGNWNIIKTIIEETAKYPVNLWMIDN